jgi:3-oxoacyl-[acyl-carrier-protein] synthase II
MDKKNIREPIAIVGIGCRFPGSPNPQAFWRLLREGVDAVSEIPADRRNLNPFIDTDPTNPGKMRIRWGGFLDNVDQFDWRGFRIMPREAKNMDPQHRLLLEVAWEALEDAGLPLEKVAGSQTGVFIGIMWNDYLRLQSRNWSQANDYTAIGNAFSFGANRISYTFDLRGPSVVVDGACAASLASVHAACQSLWMGDATMALAGGVNLILSPDIPISLKSAGLLSSKGRCKTLDVDADGFVMGEGAGIIVLKPFSKVVSSDRVYAVIRGSAINHNGRNEWIMSANAKAQGAVIREAYRKAGVDPAEVDYVELHGTGFLKGDAIEAKALGKVIGNRPGRHHPCSIGSVKSNIGHLQSASGIASIIKVALSLYYQGIPPTLHLQQVNPELSLDSIGLVAQHTYSPWPKKIGELVAGVTAISIGGINAHMVLEGANKNIEKHFYPENHGTIKTQLLPLSARSSEALISLAQAFRDFLADEDSKARYSLEDICYTASVRRSHHEYRLAVVGTSRQEFVENLEAFLQGRLPVGVFSCRKATAECDELEESGQIGGRAELVSKYLRHHDQQGSVFTTLPTQEKEQLSAIEALGILYVRGSTLDWDALYSVGGRCVQLPTYPWQRERLWLDWLDSQETLSVPTHKIETNEQLFKKRQEFLRQFESASSHQRSPLLIEYIRDQVINILGLDPSYPFNPKQGFFDAGLNSIAAVVLMNQLQTTLNRHLPAALVFEYPTAEALATYLVKEMFPQEHSHLPHEKAQSNKDKHEITLDKIENLSEDEAEVLLIKKLEEI